MKYVPTKHLMIVSFFLGTAGCAGAFATGGSASASVSVKSGHFFGHDLTHEKSVVYVLDLSGSMAGESGSVVERGGTDLAAKAAGGFAGGFLGRRAGRSVKSRIKRLKKKIEKVKLHLIASIHGLPRGSKFNIIMFDDDVIKLAPGMIRSNGFSNAAVSAFVDQLEEGGSTNMYAAVEAALYTSADHIIVLTDGMPTSSTPDEILELVARHNREDDITVSTVGVGSDQAREFLATLADENGGAYMHYD